MEAQRKIATDKGLSDGKNKDGSNSAAVCKDAFREWELTFDVPNVSGQPCDFTVD